MRKKLVGYVVSVLIKKRIVNEDDKELYEFGVNQMILFFINIGTSLIIGIALGMIWQSILFSIAYIPLRRFAGGYHASSAGACYWMSTALVIVALLIIKHLYASITCMMIILFISAIVIWFKVPVASESKPLNKNECIVFRKKTRLILSVEGVLAVILAPVVSNIAECIVIAIAFSGLMLIIPAKKNEKRASEQA